MPLGEIRARSRKMNFFSVWKVKVKAPKIIVKINTPLKIYIFNHFCKGFEITIVQYVCRNHDLFQKIYFTSH
jgi:hypothetical protein